MCHDGNSATQSVRYLNAQLTALYQNAYECVHDCEDSLDFTSVEYDKSKYNRSLAQWHFVPKPKKVFSTAELFFSAHFEQPKLIFICNHEAILYVNIKEGHYNLEHNKVSLSNYRVDATKNRPIKDVQVAFRMTFSRAGIKGSSSKIGNGSSHLIQLMILDFAGAKLQSFRPTQPHEDTEALSFYMRQYLQFLENGGSHTLFDIPDFDDDKYSPTIDYSLSSTLADVEQHCTDQIVCGVDLEQVNSFLHKKWLSVARLGHPADKLSICLAEISSKWVMGASIDAKFHIQFGAPKVRALCKDEVILTYTIDSIAFFKTDDWAKEKPEEYSNWQIAFIVDVCEEKECDGSVTNLRLNLDTARFSHHFSVVTETCETALAYFYQIVHFLSVDYLDVITQYKMHQIYHHDTRVVVVNTRTTTTTGYVNTHEHESDEFDETETTTHTHTTGGAVTGTQEGSGWTSGTLEGHKHQRAQGTVKLVNVRISKTNMHGYDQVLAVSEESINSLFYSLWTRSQHSEADASLAKWSMDIFTASFDAMRVRLLSNGNAIVWVTIHDGQLRVKSEGEKKSWWIRTAWKPAKPTDKTEVHEFSDLCLAFEVPVKMEDQASMALSDSWFSRFKLSHLFQAHGEVADRSFKHLVLDFSRANYRSELSNVDCLCEGKGRQVVDKLETAICYTKKYLAEMGHHGHNVIHTIPIFPGSAKSLFGLTSVAHCIVSKNKVTVETCGHARKASEAPVILIVGNCGGRALNFVPPEWNAGWVIAASKSSSSSLGTVCLAKSAFLEGCLLKNLEVINAQTTIVPNFAGVIDGQWNFELTTWAKHAFRKSRICKWKAVEKCDEGTLQYIWEHRDGWSHEHEGTAHDETDGEYSIDCRTRNKLTIPTVYRPGCLDIILTGESTLKVRGKEACNEWSKSSSATWSATIRIKSTGAGLSVEMAGSTKPVFAEPVCCGDCHLDVGRIHSANLPQTIDFQAALKELRSTLQGTWEYSSPGHLAYAITNPVFTLKGDLVCQLSSYEALLKNQVAAATAAASAASASAAASGASTPGTPARKSRSLIQRGTMYLKTQGNSLINLVDHGSGLLTGSSSASANTPLIQTPADAPAGGIAGAIVAAGSQSSFFSTSATGYSVGSEMKLERQASQTSLSESKTTSTTTTTSGGKTTTTTTVSKKTSKGEVKAEGF